MKSPNVMQSRLAAIDGFYCAVAKADEQVSLWVDAASDARKLRISD